MEKKHYILPLTEVTQFNTALMTVYGPASDPSDPSNQSSSSTELPGRKPELF